MPHVDARLRPLGFVFIRRSGVALGERDKIEGFVDEILDAVAVTAGERDTAAVLDHAGKPRVEDGDGARADALAQQEIFIEADAVTHFVVDGGALLPDVGVGLAGGGFAVCRHLARGARLVHLGIGEGSKFVLRVDADGVLPIVDGVAAALAFDDAAAREADEGGRERFDGFVEIVLDARRALGCDQGDAVECERARLPEGKFERDVLSRACRSSQRARVFDPFAAFLHVEGDAAELVPVGERDGERARIVFCPDERGEGVFRALLHRHRHHEIALVGERRVERSDLEPGIGSVVFVQAPLPFRGGEGKTVRLPAAGRVAVGKGPVGDEIVVERVARVVDIFEEDAEEFVGDRVLRLVGAHRERKVGRREFSALTVGRRIGAVRAGGKGKEAAYCKDASEQHGNGFFHQVPSYHMMNVL